MPEPLLQIETFGGLRVRRPDGGVTEFAPRSTGFLLAALALRFPQAATREELAELIWPEADIEQARQNLRQSLRALREALERPPFDEKTILLASPKSISLNAARVQTDIAAFEATLAASRQANTTAERLASLETAVSLYRSDLLLGFYPDFFTAARNQLRAKCLRALLTLAHTLAEQGEFDRALEYGLRAVQIDPLSEEGGAALMRIHAAQGCPSAVRSDYRELEARLKQEMESTPSEKTRALFQRLLQEAIAKGAGQAETAARQEAAKTENADAADSLPTPLIPATEAPVAVREASVAATEPKAPLRRARQVRPVFVAAVVAGISLCGMGLDGAQ